MKKQLLFAAGAAMLMMSSCNSNNESTINETIYTLNYITGVSPTGTPTGTAKISTGGYGFNFNLTQQICTLSVEMLPSEMGSTGFVSNELKYTAANDGVTINIGALSNSNLNVMFKKLMLASAFYAAPNDVNMSGVPSQSLPSTRLGFVVANYTVNDNYLVRTFHPDMVFKGKTKTYQEGVEGEYTTEDILYRVYLKDSKFQKANLVIYNAKFAQNMPVKVNLLLEDLDMELTADGMVLKGKNVVPKMAEGATLTPATNFPFDEIEFEIDGPLLNDGSCEYKVAGKYHGDFEDGHYLYFAPKQN